MPENRTTTQVDSRTGTMGATFADCPDFEESTARLTCSPAAPNLKFQREDWALFRTVEGNSVTRDQATDLLLAARAIARPVKAERLGAVGPDAFSGCAYVQSTGVARFGSVAPLAEVPFVVEAWTAKTADTRLTVCVNRTPIAGEIHAARDKRDIDAFGCGLAHTIAQAPIEAQFSLVVNVITPYMPITSDGKEPNLYPFLTAIAAVGRCAFLTAFPVAVTIAGRKGSKFGSFPSLVIGT